MIVTDTELTDRIFQVLDGLTPEEKREWARELIAWANDGE